MIKIEQLKGGCTATIERNGVRQPVYVRMVVTKAELDSLETTGGTLVYTIDEEQIVEVGETTAAPVQVAAEIPSAETQSTTAVESPVKEDEAAKPVVKTPVVKPPPRVANK